MPSDCCAPFAEVRRRLFRSPCAFAPPPPAGRSSLLVLFTSLSDFSILPRAALPIFLPDLLPVGLPGTTGRLASCRLLPLCLRRPITSRARRIGSSFARADRPRTLLWIVDAARTIASTSIFGALDAEESSGIVAGAATNAPRSSGRKTERSMSVEPRRGVRRPPNSASFTSTRITLIKIGLVGSDTCSSRTWLWSGLVAEGTQLGRVAAWRRSGLLATPAAKASSADRELPASISTNGFCTSVTASNTCRKRLAFCTDGIRARGGGLPLITF